MPRSIAARRLVPLAAAALVAVALAACGSSGAPSAQGSKVGTNHSTTSTTTPKSSKSTTTSAVAPTTTSLPASGEIGFYPFTVQGGIATGLQVAQDVSGDCTSPGVAGAVSYRCTVEPGDVHYDPCFAPPLATTGPLLCVPNPTDIDLIRFSTGALPTAPAKAPAKPVWAMRLQDGQVCVLVHATWQDGRGPFACPTPEATNSVADCHTPTHDAHGWSAECQAMQTESSPFTTQRVVNVWN